MKTKSGLVVTVLVLALVGETAYIFKQKDSEGVNQKQAEELRKKQDMAFWGVDEDGK
jgi:hypothetical protein